MNSKSAEQFLRLLLASTRPSEIQQALNNIGDYDDVDVGVEFGSDGLSWQFYDGNDSNLSTINMGTHPGRSLTERITNAIDAVLEREKSQRAGEGPGSPYEAAANWFGRPPSAPYTGIFSWNRYQDLGYDRMVNVVLREGDNRKSPTIDIVDQGIGIEPAAFQDTILSLHRGNKIKKPYLAGAFGQGGSTTHAFCQYTLIMSRSIKRPDTIGFTLVRLMNLGEVYKEDAYAYLSLRDAKGLQTVPSITLAEPVDLYPESPVDASLHSFKNGTLVRHYGYDLHGVEKNLGPGPGNLYHLLHYLMFDPLLPFRVIDLRTPGSEKDELVTGARNRLMRLALEDPPSQPGQKTGSYIRHYSPMEMVSPLRDDEPSVGIEYWVVQNYRKSGGDKIRLRTYSNELFVDRKHPIIGTVNGQNHGERTPILLRDLQLAMTSRHLIMHIDVTRASKRVRNSLIASTRQSFKEGKALSELERILVNRLKEDKILYEIERELVDNLLTKDNKDIDEEVNKEISALLQDAGFKVKDPAEVLGDTEDGDTSGKRRTSRRKGRKRPEDLPTLEYPEVTRLEIVFPKDELVIPQLDNRLVKIETDANYRYGRENRIAIRSEPNNLEVASRAQLHGGRMHWRLRSSKTAEVGDKGEVIVTLTKPNGQQLTDKIPYRILPARELSGKKKGLIPPFQIIPIDPYTEPDEFSDIWPDVSENEKTSVAYKTYVFGDEMRVYYSTGFAPYRQQVERIKQRVTLAELFRKQYEIWIGYHAIIQSKEREHYVSAGLAEPEKLTVLLEQERALVATMQAKQAVRSAEIQSKILATEAID